MEYPPYPPSVPVIPVPQAGDTVTADIPCRKCAYNLRTLSVAGACPECGTPVGRSIHGDLLRYSDPEWVRKLARGASLILLGITIIVGGAILVLIAVLMGAISRQGQEAVNQVIGVGGNVVILVGSFLLTEPDPSGLGEDQYGTSRKVIRVMLVFSVLNSLVGFLASVVPPSGHQLVMGLAGLFGLAGIVGFFAQLQYFSKLALRIPDPNLAGRANFLKIAISVSYGLLILSGVVVAIIARPGPNGLGAGFAVFGCFAGILGIAVIVFALMYLRMIHRFRRAFEQQTVFAEHEWNSHPPVAGPG
jgi:hypothetical protein